jgi:hypothetical protein
MAKRLDICENCFCMTWHINGKCGKCKKPSTGMRGYKKKVAAICKRGK